MKKNFGKKILSVVFIFFIFFMLYQSFEKLNLLEVIEGLKKISIPFVFLALILSLLDYFILSTFEFLAFKQLKDKYLTAFQIYARSFVCYAFTLNLGSLVGGLGMRFRLYSKVGIPKKEIPYVIFFSTTTNWLGYAFLFGMTCMMSARETAKLVGLSQQWIYLIGSFSLILSLGYLILCLRKKEIVIRKKNYPIPSLKIALMQLVAASCQWTVSASIIWVILKGLDISLPYPSVLFALLLSSIVGVFTHVPAGMGVLENVFLRMNFGISGESILSGLICYRVVFYLIPLLISLPFYLSFEARGKNSDN